jgi:hypothetical protein
MRSYQVIVPSRVAQKIIFNSFLSWFLSLARFRIWRGMIVRTRSIGMLRPIHTTQVNLWRRTSWSGTLTPAENIIVYTVCGIDCPYKITVKWFATDPPSKWHREHKAKDNCAKAIDTISAAFEMCRHLYSISQVSEVRRVWGKLALTDM